MADASVRRRGHGEDAIYFAADKNRYIGAVSVGFGPDGKRLRRKVWGKSKQEVRDKLRALHAELDVGLQSPAGYTVRAAVEDWLEHGLSGRPAWTVQLYRDGVRPLTDRIGAPSLRKLSAAHVRSALAGLSGQLSTRSLHIAYNCLVRAIRHAEADDLVRPLIRRQGRPSKALTIDQARTLIDASGSHRPHAYVVLLLTTGIRPEEARALRWDRLDLEAGTAAVWRSDRAGGDTKTPRSRRTLKLSKIALAALRERGAAQLADPGSKRGSCGRTTVWCSPQRSGRCWTSTTSGVSSGISP
jgi:integrase